MFFLKLIRISLKSGLYEKIKLRLQLGANRAADVNAFVFKEEKDIQTYYERRIKRLFGNKISGENQKRILFCLERLWKADCEKDYKDNYKILMGIFAQIENSVFKLERWKTLEIFFLSNGMFQLALICRKKAYRNLMERKNRWGDEWRKAIVYLENNELDDAKKMIDKIGKSWRFLGCLKQDIVMLKEYYNLLCGEERLKYDLQEWGIKDDATKTFCNALRKKDVAIIGPACGEGELTLSNTLPIIVRPNDRGEIKEDQEQKTLPTDIVYYNGPGFEWLQKDNNIEIINSFQFIVIKNVPNNNLIHCEKIRNVFPRDLILSSGILLMLPIMIMDLNQAELKSLYVCRNNMFLSKDPYRESYQSKKDLALNHNKYKKWHSFSVHNIISQFVLLQNLYNANRFVADDELKDVLKLNVDTYIEQMEQIYVLSAIFKREEK